MENFGSRTIAICENGNSLDVWYTWPIKAWILRNPELCPCKFNSSTLPSTIVSLYLILCKQHLSRGNKMINIKVAVGLAKRAIIHKITNCYRTIGWHGSLFICYFMEWIVRPLRPSVVFVLQRTWTWLYVLFILLFLSLLSFRVTQ